MDLATLEKRLDRVIGLDMREDTPGMSLLITKGEDILIRKSYGLADIEAGKKIKCDDAFVIASNTKQFTCAAIMMLKEQGLIDYDEPVERFFPDFPDYVKYVTVERSDDSRFRDQGILRRQRVAGYSGFGDCRYRQNDRDNKRVRRPDF